ncbi:hypothetical protein PTSG_00991 [Salpingoeca rosetta]|uniref:adenine phosphoribosyltransferase n=1 Tax=Salpingoeca rosetta (strain ATCC 50818 / BSB-021) TaxID=946362 RepID=F2TY29_SALR5|nr:uncharacterized protein PTSG_00991 [Salpingoeca rosetta]EGD76288.1 hypothetical protein PTSG_00991 [Salpingoeca rosetta]|eukprot:XP_004998463.1 hypothetical protein PTSG_00991 [Salpingoeca rosetta]
MSDEQKQQQKGQDKAQHDPYQDDEGIKYVRNLIQPHANFPSEGILFHDIFPALRDPVALEIILNRMAAVVTKRSAVIDYVVGLDARGFLFAPSIASRLHCGFIPIRKKGKLPGKCHTLESTKEYGADILEVQKAGLEPGARVVVVDDLIATGGTLQTSVSLLKAAGAEVVVCVCLVGLPSLGGIAKAGAPVEALIDLEAGC